MARAVLTLATLAALAGLLGPGAQANPWWLMLHN